VRVDHLRPTHLRLRALAVFVAALAFAAAAGAQPPPPSTVRLTLAEAVERALAASHRLGEATAREGAARAAAQSRGAADNFAVSLLGGYTRTNHVDEFGIPQPNGTVNVIYPDVPDNWRVRLDLAWPVYTSGRLQALERAAATEADATARDARAVGADVRLDAARAFWTLAMATDAVRVTSESLRRTEAHLRDVKTMLGVGLLAPNDVLSVEARHSRERVLVIEAKNARDVAEADLRRATGLPADAVVEIATAGEPVPAPPSLSTLVAEARQARPERQALELRVQAFGPRHEAAAAATKPTVAIVGGTDYARPNPRIFPRAPEWNASFDIGVNVAWNFWDGGKARADLAEVDSARRAAEERLAEFDRMLEFELTQRRLDLEAARAAIGAAADGVRAAADAHRVVTERFKAGLASNTEVMDAQVALLQAELDRTRAETAANLAAARLARALGR
jgi:outer membrane protein TolC